ncbi:hypothetical protein HLB35_16230 [Halomonas sp. TBZ9]|uniref:Phage head morphogenesis domain-containing protein n=1 Tax=Vreelandella azerica TaxID=2732867 RepID=A0A7Y3TZG5_9GAMM|nr:hypothetical protein [Halomonas azerica]NOG32930.1 hypothetical protein [Halomonas azerica]
MIIEKIKKILGSGGSNNTQNKTTNEEKIKNRIAKGMIEESSFIKKGEHRKAIKHITGEIDLLKSGQPLTLNEKKDFNLNTRRKMTHDLINIIEMEGTDLNEALKEIDRMSLVTRSKAQREIHFKGISEEGLFKKVELMAPNDHRACRWCKSRNKKIFTVKTSSIDEIEEVINENCTCEPWRIAMVTKV